MANRVAIEIAALPLAVREAYGFPEASPTNFQVRRGLAPPDLEIKSCLTPGMAKPFRTASSEAADGAVY